MSDNNTELRGMFKRLLHHIGLCPKARMGYNCHGRSEYQECG